MDRLFASGSAHDELRLRLHAAERALERWRRRRRGAIEATVLASVVAWAAARVGLPRAAWPTILVGVCWSAALTLAVVEWRAHRHRRRVAAQLAAELRR